MRLYVPVTQSIQDPFILPPLCLLASLSRWIPGGCGGGGLGQLWNWTDRQSATYLLKHKHAHTCTPAYTHKQVSPDDGFSTRCNHRTLRIHVSLWCTVLSNHSAIPNPVCIWGFNDKKKKRKSKEIQDKRAWFMLRGRRRGVKWFKGS